MSEPLAVGGPLIKPGPGPGGEPFGCRSCAARFFSAAERHRHEDEVPHTAADLLRAEARALKES